MALDEKRIILYVNNRIWGKNELLVIVWISSDAFELDANVANFVYYGKTRLMRMSHSYIAQCEK